MTNYMDMWMDRKIFKVNQPPGMASSIKLSWDVLESPNKPKNNRLKK